MNYEQLLLAHDVKPTANRIVVARTLGSALRPMSQSELECKILSIDKSGISRTLALFREHHLVHAIEDGSDSVRYELCHSHHDDEDDDMHPHFYCEQCHRTFCIDNTAIPAVSVPDGYELHTVNYVLKGLCPECAARCRKNFFL